MTHIEFISILKHPESVAVADSSEFREMVEAYPYFAPARLFYAKSLQRSGSIHFGSNLKFSSIYATNRRWLYYYIYPDKKVATEPVKKEKQVKSGDYFDMLSNVESAGGDSRQSLRNLADRLKSARALVESPSRKTKPQVLPELPVKVRVDKLDEFLSPSVVEPEAPRATPSEELAKNLIKQRKYEEAIIILNELNLINPKKSIYFADQIRFLEKVIANTKK